MYPSTSLPLLAKTIMPPAAQSLCDSWASCPNSAHAESQNSDICKWWRMRGRWQRVVYHTHFDAILKHNFSHEITPHFNKLKLLNNLQRIRDSLSLSEEYCTGFDAQAILCSDGRKWTLHCIGPNNVGCSVFLELLTFTVTMELISLAMSLFVTLSISSAPGWSIITSIFSWPPMLVRYFSEHVNITDSPSTTSPTVAFISSFGFDSDNIKMNKWQLYG